MPRPASDAHSPAAETTSPHSLGRWIAGACLAISLCGALSAGSATAQQDPKYVWDRQYYADVGGRQVLLYGDSAYYGKPTFGALTGEGRDSMLVGRRDGTIGRFENSGTAAAPVWKLAEERVTAAYTSGARRVIRAIDAGSQAAPTLVDIDGDGDLDLFVGTGDGRLMFFRNVGTRQLPVFELVTEQMVGQELGEYLVPVFRDINGDRAPDLIIGNGVGDVYLLINQGRIAEPSFCSALPPVDPDVEPRCKPAPKLIATIRPEIHAAPALADWDGDGDQELFVGKSDGTIDYYENRGTRTEPDWRLTQPRFLAIDDGGYAAPAFLDMNGDGKPDLIVGSSASTLAFYTNKDTGKLLDVWKVTGNLLGMEHFARGLERVVIASGDVDGDGDRDLIIGDRNGALMWIENTGSAKSPRWRMKQENLLPGTQRRNTAPLLIDIDGDGDLDLLVGGADGRIWLLRNTGTAKAPNWVMENTGFGNIDVGANSIPAAVDIDGDGDLDLFVGNGRGLVIFYQNDGTAKAPDFKLVSTRFGELSVGQAAAPAFFDWNLDKLPDLMVGNREGRLALAVNNNPPGDTQMRTWRTASATWESILVRGYSAPHFADFNGDGKPDLMVGDGEGNIRLYLNGGNDLPPPAPPAPPGTGVAAGAPPTGPGGVAVQTVPAPPRPGTAASPATPPGSLAPAATPGAPGAPAAAGAKPPAGKPVAGMQAPAGQPTAESDLAAGNDPVNTNDLAPQGSKGGGLIVPSYTLVTDKFGALSLEGKISPAFGDLDGDGAVDLVIGTDKGQLTVYRNTGTTKLPKFVAMPDVLAGMGVFRTPIPLIADLDGDGLPDIVVGSEEGKIILLKNIGEKSRPRFSRIEEPLATIRAGRGAAPAVASITNKEVTDLVIGNFAGNLLLYVREGGARSLNFKLQDRKFLGLDVGVAATPDIVDVDGDGVPDLVIGSDAGPLTHYVKAPTEKDPLAWTKETDYFKGLKIPPGSTPRLVDIDGDGDLDLFVGTAKGTLLFFRNDAGKEDGGPR